MASRKQCVKDILLETDGTPNNGWQTPPDVPNVIIESRKNTFDAALRSKRPTIFIKKNMSFDPFEHSQYYENRVWNFPISIITDNDTDLQAYFDQSYEVFNRYTNNPWATDTNGITYKKAKLVEGRQDRRKGKFVWDCVVQLAELFVDVVIA